MDPFFTAIQSGAEATQNTIKEVINRLGDVGKAYENAVKGASAVTTSINMQLAELSRLRDSKQLTAAEELAVLGTIAERYNLSAAQRLQLDSQVHAAKLRGLQEELALIEEEAKRPQNSQDYMSKINAYTELSGQYSGKAEALAVIEAERVAAAESRAVKIAQIDAKELADFISAQERKVAVAKRLDGLVVNGAEYNYDMSVQMQALEEMVKATEAANAKLLETQNSWSQAEQAIYLNNLAALKKYAEQREDLQIDMLKAGDAANRALEQSEIAAQQALEKAQEESQRRRLASAQSYIDAQIKLLKQAAQEQIDAYNAEIDEITRSMELEDRTDRDTDEQSKIDRLREQAVYAQDEYSRMQLLRQADERQAALEKAHAKEAAEDKKAAIRQEIEDIRASLSKQEELLREYRNSEAIKSDIWVSGVVEATVKKISGQYAAISDNTDVMLGILNSKAEAFASAGEGLGMSLFDGVVGATPEGAQAWRALAIASILEAESGFFDAGKVLGQNLFEGFMTITEKLAQQLRAIASSISSTYASSNGGYSAAGYSSASSKQASVSSTGATTITVNQVLEGVTPSPYEVAKATKDVLKDVLNVWA